jgi:hypothetical protein
MVAQIWAVATSGKNGRGDEKEKCETGKRGKKGNRGASGVGFATCKEQREWAELCFMARARQIGLAVLKPYGDSSQYDVGIEHQGRLARVQVKSTTFIRERTFTCNMVGPGGRPYKRGTLDFFAVYPVQANLWYILPFEATSHKKSVSLQFTPEKAGHKCEPYLEAWHLLRL